MDREPLGLGLMGPSDEEYFGTKLADCLICDYGSDGSGAVLRKLMFK